MDTSLASSDRDAQILLFEATIRVKKNQGRILLSTISDVPIAPELLGMRGSIAEFPHRGFRDKTDGALYHLTVKVVSVGQCSKEVGAESSRTGGESFRAITW